MKLIDADALMKELEREVELADDWNTAHEIANVVKYALISAKDINVPGKWISVKDRLPDSNHVLARCEIRNLYKPKSYTCVAFYAKKHSISCGNCVDEDYCHDYDDETDEYYLKEGWYEVIRNWDEYGSIVIGDFVTHWMPLPEPPEVKQE